MYYSPLFEKRRSNQIFLPFVGIDDFAFLKGHTYGTIICDLTTHQPVALLPDRKPETVTSRLNEQSIIEVVSRDGFRAFRQAISQASSTISQVYDRWHFIRAAKRQVDSCLVSILPASITFNNREDQPNLVQAETKQERIQLERNAKKLDLIKTVQQEYQKGKKKSVLAKEFDLDPRTITKYLKTTNSPLIKPRGKRKRQTAEFHEQIGELEIKGHTIKQIDSIIRDYGYTGTLSGVRVAVESIRKERKYQHSQSQKQRISRQQVSACIWKLHSTLSEQECHLLEQCFTGYPSLKPFYDTVQTFKRAWEDYDYNAFFRIVKTTIVYSDQPFVSIRNTNTE
ncbi:transposase [Neobacillus sp. MM2021_6]|nr:transposase [Neobacillus sp. MM2021_6]